MITEHRVRLVSSAGHDFPAWVLGNRFVLFKIQGHPAAEGRAWAVYDTITNTVGETVHRADAVRWAEAQT